MLNLFFKTLLAVSFSISAFAADNPVDKPAMKKPSSKAAETHQCGIFEVTGFLKKAGNNYFILLAPGSRSEAQIVLTTEATKSPKHPVILPAQESFITAKIQMNSPLMHYRGTAQKISDVRLAVPNELRGDKGTGLKLIEAKPCIIQGM